LTPVGIPPKKFSVTSERDIHRGCLGTGGGTPRPIDCH
jgi:hypothetical protein